METNTVHMTFIDTREEKTLSVSATGEATTASLRESLKLAYQYPRYVCMACNA